MNNRLLHADHAELLYPESFARRALPLNFEESDRGLFEHELCKPIPATERLQFNKCRVAGNGMFFRDLRVCAESFGYKSMLEEWATPGNMLRFFVSNYALKKTRPVDEDALLFIDNWSGAYFHWITDTLSRLYAVRDMAKGVPILLPASYAQCEYTVPSLEPFRVRAIRYLEKNQVLQCRRLVVPTHTAPSGNYNEEVVRGMRDLFRNHFGGSDASQTGERVYVSRRKAKVRRIVNEAEVETLLTQYGFETVCFEDFAFEKQVAIASKACYLISNHGAGMTNMLFMPMGAKVLELRKKGDGHNNCYFALASGLGLPYLYQLCESSVPDEAAYSADLVVNIELLRKNVEKMIVGNL